MPERSKKEPLDESLLAEVEEDMMQLLNREQCDTIALWLKSYGDAFVYALPTACKRRIRTNFRYAANRLEVMGKLCAEAPSRRDT